MTSPATETARPRRRPSGPVAVFHPDRGVGDLMWHLPTIRGIAALAPEGRVVLAARPSTRAGALLRVEPTVSRVVDLPYRTGRARHLREIADFHAFCRRERPRAVWILEKIGRPAMGAAFAGVPERRGFGLGHDQEAWLSPGPRLPRAMRPEHRITKLAAFEALYELDVPSREPALRPDPALVETLRARFASAPRPWIVVGIGASEESKRWPLSRFLDLQRALSGGTVFWLGGPEDVAAVDAALAGDPGAAAAQNVSSLEMDEAAALISLADAFVGGDSGPLNVAAAVGRPSLGLFGATPPLAYSRHLLALQAPNADLHALDAGAVLPALHDLLEGSRRAQA